MLAGHPASRQDQLLAQHPGRRQGEESTLGGAFGIRLHVPGRDAVAGDADDPARESLDQAEGADRHHVVATHARGQHVRHPRHDVVHERQVLLDHFELSVKLWVSVTTVKPEEGEYTN